MHRWSTCCITSWCIYIGHIAGIGAAALTGVGLFTPILMLLNAFAMLVGAGGAPRTAIALGQGDKEQAEKIISNSFTMLLLFSVVLTVVFYAGAPTLLRLFGASDATLPYALSYSRIYILGSVFVLLVLGMNPSSPRRALPRPVCLPPSSVRSSTLFSTPS